MNTLVKITVVCIVCFACFTSCRERSRKQPSRTRTWTVFADKMAPVDRLYFTLEFLQTSKNMGTWHDRYIVDDSQVVRTFVEFFQKDPSAWRYSLTNKSTGRISIRGKCRVQDNTAWWWGISSKGESPYIFINGNVFEPGAPDFLVKSITQQEQEELVRMLGIIEGNIYEGDFKIVSPARLFSRREKGKDIQFE